MCRFNQTEQEASSKLLLLKAFINALGGLESLTPNKTLALPVEHNSENILNVIKVTILFLLLMSFSFLMSNRSWKFSKENKSVTAFCAHLSSRINGRLQILCTFNGRGGYFLE